MKEKGLMSNKEKEIIIGREEGIENEREREKERNECLNAGRNIFKEGIYIRIDEWTYQFVIYQ